MFVCLLLKSYLILNSHVEAERTAVKVTSAMLSLPGEKEKNPSSQCFEEFVLVVKKHKGKERQDIKTGGLSHLKPQFLEYMNHQRQNAAHILWLRPVLKT